MDRLLSKLERRFGRYAFDNLTLVLVASQAAVLVLSLAKPGFAGMLELDPALVREGQYWRLISYLFLPADFRPIWALLSLYVLHMMGTALESHWGAFKYQLYWLVGTVFTAVGAFAFGVPATNHYLLMALFLAFATLYPRYEFRLFFVFPVQVRWLAVLDALYVCYAIGMSPGWSKLVPVLAIGNYLLFFGEQLVGLLRGKAKQAQRSNERKRVESEERIDQKLRSCAVCGITSLTDPEMDFRVCSCAKHDGRPTEMCLPHARNH